MDGALGTEITPAKSTTSDMPLFDTLSPGAQVRYTEGIEVLCGVYERVFQGNMEPVPAMENVPTHHDEHRDGDVEDVAPTGHDEYHGEDAGCEDGAPTGHDEHHGEDAGCEDDAPTGHGNREDDAPTGHGEHHGGDVARWIRFKGCKDAINLQSMTVIQEMMLENGRPFEYVSPPGEDDVCSVHSFLDDRQATPPVSIPDDEFPSSLPNMPDDDGDDVQCLGSY